MCTQGLIERLAKQARTDMESARQELVKSLGGIPIGRPGRPEEVRTSSHFWSQIEPYRLTEVNTSLMEKRF